MTDLEKDRIRDTDDKTTKPAGQDVSPPEERVDDEAGSDRDKTTQRQE